MFLLRTAKYFIFLFVLCTLNCSALEVKIGLLTVGKPIKIGSGANADLINLSTNKTIGEINKRESLIIENKNGLISIFNKTRNISLGAFNGPVYLKPRAKNGLVYSQNTWYRGSLLIITNGSKQNLTIINNVELEDYLLSVLPSEMPYKWSREALKAQAVAARSYTLGYLGRRKVKGYDLESTVEDQVYLGASHEKWSTSQAVKDTKGIILVDINGNPLIALYHSSGGGYTDSIENLWNKKPCPHIQPRPDYDDASPYFKWTKIYKSQDLNAALKDLMIGNVKNIVPLSVSISNRVTWLELDGESGKTQIRGEDLRRLLKLPSSMFNVNLTNGNYNFTGRGFGHGLGLSQWGSKSLAENGFNYKEILYHYYTGVKLVKLED